MDINLENKLRTEFLNAVNICKNQYGYNPTRFLQMLEKYGPVNTAINLVMDPKCHDGFTKMWELRRLDLTVEAIICRSPYNRLFSHEVIEKAKEKLEQLGYRMTET